MTRGSASCMRRATVAPPATSSSVSDDRVGNVGVSAPTADR